MGRRSAHGIDPADLRIERDPVLESLLPTLRTRARNHDSSIEDLEALPGAWARAAQRPVFREVQDQLVQEWYFEPVYRYASRYHIRTYLGFFCLYDALIQHGAGRDRDSLGAMLAKVDPRTDSEKSFLLGFLKVRRDTLIHPYDPATQREWRKSIGRVAVLRDLIHKGNFELQGPVDFEVYGNSYRVP
ncbi:MAG: hypothetical protein EBX52_12850 [Proteobacteria bacterium]|nr:hypothetical protein [Pseudomonadota bacterium]